MDRISKANCAVPNTSVTGCSLRKRILLYVMPIALLGLLSLSYAAHWYIETIIENELSNSMLLSGEKSAENINHWFKIIMLEPETIAATPVAKRINEDFAALDKQNINRYQVLHAQHPDIFLDIYAANREGEYHTVLPDGDGYRLFVGDIANRPYFLSIMSGGPTQVTPPLISRTTGEPTIFAVAPILDQQGKPQGLVGAGISLQYIQQIAQGLSAGETGYGVVIANDGTFVHYVDSDMVWKNKIRT